MEYQFIHVGAYARVGARMGYGDKKSSIREVLDKISRVSDKPQHTPSTSTSQSPLGQPPKVIFGCAPSAIEQMAEDWALKSKDAQGHKIRKEGLILLVGIVSLPIELEQNFDEFSKATSEYLQEKYEERLKSIAVRYDEAHPRLHFYVLPNIGEKFEDIHQILRATNKAKIEGKTRSEQFQAYKQSKREFQNEFSKKVSMRFELVRIGPGSRRLSLSEWQAEQAA